MQGTHRPDVTVITKGITDEQSIGSQIKHPGGLLSV